MKAHFLEIKNIVHIKYFVGIIVCCSWTLTKATKQMSFIVNKFLYMRKLFLEKNINLQSQTKKPGTVLKMVNAQVSQLLMQRYSHIPHSPNTMLLQ